ncbi:MAG: PLP-dependent aminotransferase family protein [Anaerolineales bacterium]
MLEPLPVAQINTPPEQIDLGRGDPQLALLPLDVLRRAAADRLSQSDNTFLQYGTEQGDGYLRRALASFLGAHYGFEIDPAALFITSGISAALDLLCTLFTKPGDTILVEEPSYFLALRIFADRGLRVIPAPMDEEGLVVDELYRLLELHRPRFLYLIPVFQNPTGRTLSEDRRRALLELAHQHDLLLIADEVYQLLSYTTTPPRSFAFHTDHANVIALGSFSKILAPGLRLGWLHANPTVIKRLASCGLLDSGGGMNPFTSAIVRGVVEDGDLERNISRLVGIYTERVTAMDTALRRCLPQAEFAAAQGGYFFWVRLPGIDTQELRSRAPAHQVDFRPGSLFSSAGGLHDYMRLGISFYDARELEQGVQRLAELLGSDS